MHEFIAALRQLRVPIVVLAVAVLLLQTLVSGLASAHVAGQRATGVEAAALCHGGGEDGTPAGAIAHDCCTFCCAAPALLPPASIGFWTLDIVRRAGVSVPRTELSPLRRAIRAGPSRAPPSNS